MSEHDNPKTARETLLGEPGGQSLAEMSESTTIIDSSMLQQARASLSANHQACLLVIAGPHVGRMLKLGEDAATLGRSPKVDFELSDAGISRKHARINRRGDDFFVEDLRSANGTYVNGRRVSGVLQLQQGDKITLGTETILKFTFQDEFDENFQRQMLDAAHKDELTGAYNKAHMMKHLQRELLQARRRGTQLSMLLFDIDHFKHTNDTYGHLAGDHILSRIGELVGEAVGQTVGKNGKFARYGGEEFAIICRDIPVDTCARLGNHVRKLIEQTDFSYEGQSIPVTISVGVSGFPAVDARAPKDLIGAADEALYAAKDAGRNRVMVKG